MIWWVYHQVKKIKAFDEIYVATDDERIEAVCKEHNMNVVMTSESHRTGTDRIGEAAEKIKADVYVNIQGDEPLVEPETIKTAVRALAEKPEIEVVNLMTKIKEATEINNPTIVKVVTANDGRGIFLSRSPIPYPKIGVDIDYYKHIGIYALRAEALKFFCSAPVGKIEAIEEIEMLRFIENGKHIHFVEVGSNTVAVDTPKDLIKVRRLLKNKIMERQFENE